MSQCHCHPNTFDAARDAEADLLQAIAALRKGHWCQAGWAAQRAASKMITCMWRGLGKPSGAHHIDTHQPPNPWPEPFIPTCCGEDRGDGRECHHHHPVDFREAIDCLQRAAADLEAVTPETADEQRRHAWHWIMRSVQLVKEPEVANGRLTWEQALELLRARKLVEGRRSELDPWFRYQLHENDGLQYLAGTRWIVPLHTDHENLSKLEWRPCQPREAEP